jgi:hypothetical protein
MSTLTPTRAIFHRYNIFANLIYTALIILGVTQLAELLPGVNNYPDPLEAAMILLGAARAMAAASCVYYNQPRNSDSWYVKRLISLKVLAITFTISSTLFGISEITYLVASGNTLIQLITLDVIWSILILSWIVVRYLDVKDEQTMKDRW